MRAIKQYPFCDYFITDLGYSSRPFGLIINDRFISRLDIFSSLIVKIKTWFEARSNLFWDKIPLPILEELLFQWDLGRNGWNHLCINSDVTTVLFSSFTTKFVSLNWRFTELNANSLILSVAHKLWRNSNLFWFLQEFHSVLILLTKGPLRWIYNNV